MNTTIRASALAIAIASGTVASAWTSPVQAQPVDQAATQRELARMRAQLAAMANRIDALETQLVDARAKADTAQAATAAIPQQVTVAQATAAPTVTAKPPTQIAWDGAPRITGENGWSFKPRGRVQVDVGGIDAPRGIAESRELGIGTEFRRVYLGVDGTIPGGFGYRAEADVAASTVDLADVFLTYKATPNLTLTIGHHKPFLGLEETTSDLFSSFMERAAFTSAFGFERRIGASGTYVGKDLLVQGGVFTDNANDLNSDVNNSYSVDGRAVFMPKLVGGQLHVGGSIHTREFNDQSATARYRARPFVHTTDLRLIDTRAFAASGEDSYGAELAYIRGRLHATAEGHWITSRRPGLADPTFNGGYAEVGYLLTDDVTGYKGGVYDRIRPKHPVDNGGIGAIQLNGRYDWLDLNDAGVIGGKQQIAAVSLVWMPTDYVRFIVNYGHLWITDAAVPAAGDTRYGVDSFGMRAQVDF